MMTGELDLSVPKREERRGRRQPKAAIFLTGAVLIAVIVNIAVVLLQQGGSQNRSGSTLLSAELQKKLALKLEKQGLYTVSAKAWKEYLTIASPDNKETAIIWYRIGKLYQKDNDDAKALDGYYRSESFAKIEEISPEISRRIQECLESMGKFAALRYELADRVGVGTSSEDTESSAKGDHVVAEIGPQKITKSDLDLRIELQIDRQISQLASHIPEDRRNKRKEEILKRFSAPSQRRMFLNQYILEEILYRKARESRLMDDPEIRAMLKDQERGLLARMVVEREFAENIKIMPTDLDTYYEAHKKEYVRPERAHISQILVKDSATAEYIREKLKNGEAFGALAAKMSIDASTREKEGKIADWIEKGKGDDIAGIGTSEDAVRVIFSTDADQIAGENIKTDKGIHIIKVLEKESERQKTFEEVKNEIFRALRSRKERDVQQKLLKQLKQRYDVVIHQSAFADTESKIKPEK